MDRQQEPEVVPESDHKTNGNDEEDENDEKQEDVTTEVDLAGPKKKKPKRKNKPKSKRGVVNCFRWRDLCFSKLLYWRTDLAFNQ